MDADSARLCIIQKFEMMELDGNPIQNSYDCPLLTLLPTLHFVSTAHVHSAVSIVHECTEACTFVELPSTHSVEREDVSTTNLVYQHDFDSHLMCIVCIISFFQQGLHHFY